MLQANGYHEQGREPDTKTCRKAITRTTEDSLDDASPLGTIIGFQAAFGRPGEGSMIATALRQGYSRGKETRVGTPAIRSDDVTQMVDNIMSHTNFIEGLVEGRTE